jgi:two-component system, LytTR family, sensor kinase
LNQIAHPDATAATERLHRGAVVLIAMFCSVHFVIMVIRAHLNHASGDPGFHDPMQSLPKRFFFALFGAAMCYVIYLGLRPLRRGRFGWQAGVGTALALGVACIQAVGNAMLFNRGEMNWLPNFLYAAMYWFWFFLSWTTAYLALSYSFTVQEQERRAAELAVQAQEAQVRALRYQINPHFLFNTLNAIAALVRDAPDKAEEMVLQLSTFFRRSLAVNPMEDLTLSEEVDLQRLYLEIERTRFPDRLRFEVALEGDSAKARVPALLLQPLVENAVKHGVSRSETATCIRIRARLEGPALEIVVENDARAAGAGPRGESVGLRNVRDRLRSRFGEAAALATEELAGGGFRNTLRIPITR